MEKQLTLDITQCADDECALHWLGFTLDTPDEFIEARFLRRFGRFPNRIITLPNLKLAGPVPGVRYA